MAIYSLKRSYQLKDLQEVDFKDLWGGHGIFTTMWIFGKPPKILFFENHIKNLIKSLKIYRVKKLMDQLAYLNAHRYLKTFKLQVTLEFW